MKKALSLVLALGMAASLLAGCGGATSSSAPASEAGSTAASGSTAAAEGDYAGQTLKVAAIETAYGADMWQQIADAFEAHTGATVELTTDKNLEDVIDPQMKAGNFYDVVHLAAGREKALPETMLKEIAMPEQTDILQLNVPAAGAPVGIPMIGGNRITGSCCPGRDRPQTAPAHPPRRRPSPHQRPGSSPGSPPRRAPRA